MTYETIVEAEHTTFIGWAEFSILRALADAVDRAMAREVERFGHLPGFCMVFIGGVFAGSARYTR